MSLTVLLACSATHFLEKLTRAALAFSETNFLVFSEFEPPAAELAEDSCTLLGT